MWRRSVRYVLCDTQRIDCSKDLGAEVMRFVVGCGLTVVAEVRGGTI